MTLNHEYGTLFPLSYVALLHFNTESRWYRQVTPLPLPPTSSDLSSTSLYACESWTLTADLQRRIQAMEMRCYRKILRISYEDHVTNEEVRAKIQQAIGPHEDLTTIVKRRKLRWYSHVSCS